MNEERFIYGGAALWIKRSCTELLHSQDGPFLWGLYHAGWCWSVSTVDTRGQPRGVRMVWQLPQPYPRRGACEALSQRREDTGSHERKVSPCLWRGPEAAPTHRARGSWPLTHDESHSGGKEGGLCGNGGRESRRRGPWPHSGQRVISVPVHCHSHSATLLTGREGGSGGWSSGSRHWRQARALHRELVLAVFAPPSLG
jgi:hypothetical protein